MCMNSLKGEVWVSDNNFLATGSTYHHVEYSSTEYVGKKIHSLLLFGLQAQSDKISAWKGWAQNLTPNWGIIGIS